MKFRALLLAVMLAWAWPALAQNVGGGIDNGSGGGGGGPPTGPAGGALGGVYPNPNLADAAANTVLANATSGSTGPTPFSMPSCNTTSKALQWTTNTGFACNSAIAATVAITDVTGLGTGIATALGVNVGNAGAPVLFNGAGGTPSSLTLTNAAGLPKASITGFGTGVSTALGNNIGSAGAPVTFNGAGGTPSSITLTNATSLPISTGVSGLGTGVATFLGTPSAANFTSMMTGPVNVAGGGTGNATLTAYAPVFGGTTGTAALQSGTVGTAGQVLTSNGAGALPTFQTAGGGGCTTICTMTSLALNGASIGSYDLATTGQAKFGDTITITSMYVPSGNSQWYVNGGTALINATTVTLNTNSVSWLFSSSSMAGPTGSALSTGAPAGSSSPLWKFGALQTGAVVLDTTRSIFVDIGGTVYKLMVAQ